MNAIPLMHAAGAWPWLAPLWILLWIVVFATIFRFVVFRGRGPWGRRAARPTASEILAERFARGEIDDAEYRSRLETLSR
jgi:putative membrane protein